MHRTKKPFATIIDREIARAFELGYRAAGGKGDAEQARRDFMERGGISADDLEEFFDRITPEQRDKLREVRAIVENEAISPSVLSGDQPFRSGARCWGERCNDYSKGMLQRQRCALAAWRECKQGPTFSACAAAAFEENNKRQLTFPTTIPPP